MDSLGDEIDVLMGFYDEGTKKLYQKAQAITVEYPPVRLIMPLHDELASKELVTWKDLKGRTLHLIRPGWGSTMDAIRQDIMVNHPEITIETFQFFKTQAINDCLSQGDIIVGFDLWNILNPFAAIRPMDWDYSMEYGLIYSPEPSEAVREFVEALEQLLKEEMQ